MGARQHLLPRGGRKLHLYKGRPPSRSQCIYINKSINIYIYIYMYLSLSIYIYIYIHLSLSIYIYIYIYIHIFFSLGWGLPTLGGLCKALSQHGKHAETRLAAHPLAWLPGSRKKPVKWGGVHRGCRAPVDAPGTSTVWAHCPRSTSLSCTGLTFISTTYVSTVRKTNSKYVFETYSY